MFLSILCFIYHLQKKKYISFTRQYTFIRMKRCD